MSRWAEAWRGYRLRRSGSAEARAYRSRRVSTIRAALVTCDAHFAFLAGDSHAEFLGRPDLGGHTTVNGGIGGATAPVYAAELERLAFPGQAGLAVLVIGSNDIAAVHGPLSARSVARFARGATAVLATLERRARIVWVAAIPPIRPTPAYPQIVEAVPVYTTVLATIAAARGCPFIDPFASFRDGPGGWAKPGAMADGTHLADYRPVAAFLSALAGETGHAAGGVESGLHRPASPAIAPAHRCRTATGPGT